MRDKCSDIQARICTLDNPQAIEATVDRLMDELSLGAFRITVVSDVVLDTEDKPCTDSLPHLSRCWLR